MSVYRRKEDSNTWHWCANCSEFPTGTGIVSRHTKPEYGEFCKNCDAKEKSGDCKEDSFFSVRK